jgi:trans-aconitate 2-methyltransferase
MPAVTPTNDPWNPAQYEKFRAQRMEPFFDLLGFIKPLPGGRAIDLGCGTGELTALLAERLDLAHIEGVDSSAAMLEKAAARAGARVSFRQADIAAVDGYQPFQLVFSNAAFHWVPDNERLMRRILSQLAPGAQVAIQLPFDGDHPSRRIAHELAASPRFSARLGGFVSRSHGLPLERYAELLWEHGLSQQTCIEKIYGHELPHCADVVEWVKGTLLTPYLQRLDKPAADEFLTEYKTRLLAALGDRAPYFFPFRRVLFWGAKG